ncbi:MAG: molybdate ABC transporter substrate-binding protein [Planctomycetaceae bacterium]|nr:molybdate ABC transporter substrate-binding protein [Planctomycetaceae bacterium]MDP7277098.1 molybdate ABC transporter substrate-binding protein [Planctomycetaceae bacterium]
MSYFANRSGSASHYGLLTLVGVLLVVVLGWMLSDMGGPAVDRIAGGEVQSLTMFCAAGIRGPVEAAAKQYEQEYQIRVNLDYGGSNTLLNRLQVAHQGDLFLAADESYIKTAQEKGLVAESIPLAHMKPVLAVAAGNPKKIHSIKDLLRDDVRTAIGNPEQAAIGKRARKLLTASGDWKDIQAFVTRTGTFLPTVPEVANAVKIGSVDAAIIWDTTTVLVDGIDAVSVPELDKGRVLVTVGVLKSSENPTAAIRFARYLAARDRGLLKFKEKGFQPVEGDEWSEIPELTFFCGSINRRAVEGVITAFQQREGVQVNTIYNGCGILTAQMKTIRDQETVGFPDTYMACDTYYLDAVGDLFQEAVEVSDTEVVIALPKGNPRGIKSLVDLTKPGVRVAIGQPEQCTIGILTRQVLRAEGVFDAITKNVVTQTATSALLIAPVATGAADASLAYLTDAIAESDKVDTVRISSEAAKAIQPFGIARSSRQKHLARRLKQHITRSREDFESAGFHWRLETDKSNP